MTTESTLAQRTGARWALGAAMSVALLALLLTLGLSSSLGSVAAAQDQEEPDGPECLQVRGTARMQAYGYAHVVTVTNRCRREARCEVWTTADPTPRHALTVRPGHSESVTTRIGSPAREVIPGHQCEFR